MTDDKMPGEMTPETPVSAEPVVLEVKNITKRFPGVLANNQVSFSLRRGEILALLGENGAGKSTLMNIVYGLYHQDEGEVFLKGKEVRFTSPREAIHSGIGMVHQHFKLIEVMTVAENVVLGEENERPRWRTLFWAFFLLLVGLVIGYQLTYRQSLLFRLFGNVNEDWQAAQVLMHDSLTLLVFVVFLPFVISRWIFRKMGRPDWYIPAFAIVYLMLLVMLGGAEHILLLAGLPIVAGVVGIFLKHTWPPTRPLDLLDISLPAIIPAGILGFLVAIHSLGTTLQFLFPLTLVVFICAAISASLAWVFTWLYDHWDGVTSALRIGWGIAWRVGLITVAVWIGGQSFRISKMALITAILQHQPDKVQMRELDPNNFVAQPQADGTEAVNPLAKGSMTINQPLNIAWRDIEQLGKGFDGQVNGILTAIDTSFRSSQEIRAETETGLTMTASSNQWKGLNPLLRDEVDEIPPLVHDLVLSGLLLLFIVVCLNSWRGLAQFPDQLTRLDIALMTLIGLAYVVELTSAPQDLHSITHAIIIGLGVLTVLATIGWTYRQRQRRIHEILPIFPLDNAIDALANSLYVAASVRNTRATAERVRELSRQYGLEVDPKAVVEKLPVGLQQRVEIIKALYRKADVLILDEPTAVLTPQESRELFRVMRELAAEGVSIIFITHKLKEVFEVASRIVVMRGGEVVGTTPTKDATESSLAAMMVGREVLLQVEKAPAKPQQTVLQVENLIATDDRGAKALKGISFEVRAGEVLGVAGVQGNGQTELVEVLTGLRRLDSGSIQLLGNQMSQTTPRGVKNMRVSHVPEDRQRFGMVKTFNIAENLVLNDYYQSPYAEAPTAPQTVPLTITYGLIFGVIFAGLGTLWLGVWENTLWQRVLDFLAVPERYSTVPSDRALTGTPAFYLNDALMVALLSLLGTTLVFAIIAHLGASLGMSFVRRFMTTRMNGGGGLVLNQMAAVAHADELIREFDIRTPSALIEGGALSGGNQQKMVVAREFSRQPSLLIAAQPTRGIDVGSIEFIHKQIIAQRDEGAAVLLVSAELDEVMSLSDRIAVMYQGEILDIVPAETATREQLGLLMAGIHKKN